MKIILKLMKRFAADVRGSALHGERNQPNSQQCEGSGAAALGAVGKALTLQTVAAPKFHSATATVHGCAHTKRHSKSDKAHLPIFVVLHQPATAV